MATQSALDPISDAQTARRGIVPQRPRDSSFRSRRAVSFKCLYRKHSKKHRVEIFRRTARTDLGRTDMLKDSYARSKRKKFHINDYDSIAQARDRIGHFITHVYNQKRPHSALGYLTPMEFSTTKLILTLRNCGLNKRMHYSFFVFRFRHRNSPFCEIVL